MFSKGKTVEVFLEGFRDVWFPATVIEEIESNSFLVEYQSAVSTGPAKVVVDILHIRPSPPHLKDNNFACLETVDAFVDFGWWSGLISEKLDDNKYVVFLKAKKIQREVQHSEIRPHVDWKNGSWFSASQDVLILSEYQEHSRNGSSGTITVNSEGRMENIVQSTPCNGETSNAATSLQEKMNLPPESDEAGWLPCQLNTTPMDSPNEDAYYSFVTSTSSDTRTSSSDQPLVDALPSIKALTFSPGKKARTKRHKVGVSCDLTPDPLTSNGGIRSISPLSGTQALTGDQNPGEPENPTPNPLKRRVGRPSKLPMSNAQGKTGGEIDNNTPNPLRRKAGRPSKSGTSSQGASAGAKKDDALNSEGGGVKRTRASSSLNVLEEEHQRLHGLPTEKVEASIMEGNQVEGGEGSPPKRRRGRPRKFPAKSPEASSGVNRPNGGASAEVMVVENTVGSPTVVGMEATKELMKSVGVDKKILELKTKSSSSVKVTPVKKNKLQKRKQFSSKRGRRRTISVNTESPIQDPRSVSVGKTPEVYIKDSVTKAETAVNQSPSNVSDDQPLSTWFEGVSLGKNVEECHVGDVMGGLPGDDQMLPFVKDQVGIWKSIEAHEAFRKFPQKPHFHALESVKEGVREGLALGFMINFTSVVKKISGLTSGSPRSLIEDNLDMLLELENNGFEVNKLRGRLTELLLMKDKEEELQDRSTEKKSKIMENTEDRSKVCHNIDKIDKKISILQEEREQALAMKEEKDKEIADLESSVKGIDDEMASVQHQFEALVAAPW